MVISVALLIINAETSSVTVSVAGHCPLIMVHKDDIREVNDPKITGPPLGAPREAYVEAELQLYDNDVLLLFTDGITKLESPDGKSLSRRQQLDMIEVAASGQRSAFDDRLSRQLREFRGDSPLIDDVAFVMINRTPSAGTIENKGSWGMESETQEA